MEIILYKQDFLCVMKVPTGIHSLFCCCWNFYCTILPEDVHIFSLGKDRRWLLYVTNKVQIEALTWF